MVHETGLQADPLLSSGKQGATTPASCFSQVSSSGDLSVLVRGPSDLSLNEEMFHQVVIQANIHTQGSHSFLLSLWAKGA